MEEFNVVGFQQKAKAGHGRNLSKGHVPVVAGGTGFYIQALLYDIDFKENEEGNQIRMELEALAEEKGNEYLHQLLQEVDPESAKAIHANNRKRVIRALEYYRQTGEKISSHNEAERQKESPYDFLYYVLNTERAALYQRIDRRVDNMLADGLVEEVQKLKDMGCSRSMVSMQGLGIQGNSGLFRWNHFLRRSCLYFKTGYPPLCQCLVPGFGENGM